MRRAATPLALLAAALAAALYAALQLRAAAAFQPAGYNAGETANLVHGLLSGAAFGGPWAREEALLQFGLLQPTYFLLALLAVPLGGAKALLALNAALAGLTGLALFGYARARTGDDFVSLALTAAFLASGLLALMATGGYADWAVFSAFAMAAHWAGAAGRGRTAILCALLAAAARPMGALILGLLYALLALRRETRPFALRGLAAVAAWGVVLGLGALAAARLWGVTPGEGFSFLERQAGWARLWADAREDWWIVKDRYPQGVVGSGTILGLLGVYLLPTGLLPLRTPLLWLAAAPPVLLVMGWGFAFPTALQGGLVVFFVAAAEALARLRINLRPPSTRAPLALWLLACGALSHWATPPATIPAPLSMAWDAAFYETGAHAEAAARAAALVPKDAAVLADYGFMTHLWDRRRLDFIEGAALPKGFDYALLDLTRPSLAPSQQDRLEQLATLLGSAEAGVLAFEDGVLLLRRGAAAAENARVLGELARYARVGEPGRR